MNKFTATPIPSRVYCVTAGWIQRWGRAVMWFFFVGVIFFFTHTSHTLSQTRTSCLIGNVDSFHSWHFSVVQLIMWHCTSLNSQAHKSCFSCCVCDFNWVWSFFVICRIFFLLIWFLFVPRRQVAHFNTGGLLFIVSTLLCFHERSEHSFHPICFQLGSLRQLMAHTLLPRQTGGPSEHSEVCEPSSWENKYFHNPDYFCLFSWIFWDWFVHRNHKGKLYRLE